MIPILYEATETSFATNGIARLRDMISCVVTEERNGVFECDFEYPIDGAHFEDIIPGRIIAVTHDESGDLQPFDIVSYSKPINGVASFHAVHISYRQSFLTVTGSGISSLADALDLLTQATPTNPFTYDTDITSSAYFAGANGTPKTVRELLGGSEGSILDSYGGEYEFNKFSVKLKANRGQIRDFTIRYGINMTEYTDDADYFGVFNSCVPYWSGGGETPVIGSRVDSGLTSYAGRGLCVPLDLTDKFENAPTTSQLEAEALNYMLRNQTHLPQQNIKVDFLRLQDYSGYEGFENLLQCNLCDTISVVFPKYGMTGAFKIVRTVWDVLESRYTEMELGALSTSLSEALGISGSNVTMMSGGGGDTIKYGVCSTAQGTAAKTVTVSPALEALEEGELIFVKFSNANTASNPTLNVNGLGPKTMRRYGTTSPSTSAASSWNAGSVVALVYDGSYWQMVGWINTTYSSMTVAEYEAGTGTTARTITPARLKGAIQYWMSQPTVTTFNPGAGSTASGQECYYAKVGALVMVNLAITGLTAGAVSTITTLPTGYRPRSKVTAAIQAGARSDFCSLEIATDGTVSVAAHASRTSAFGLVTYLVE